MLSSEGSKLQPMRVSDLNKAFARQSEQSRNLGERVARGFEEERERQSRVNGKHLALMVERDAVPFQTRDALLDVSRQLSELRADNARAEREARSRERWLLWIDAATFVVAVAAIVLSLVA